LLAAAAHQSAGAGQKNGRWLERPKLPKEEDENMEPDVLSMLS
jgi:hypothetical protein